MFSLERERADMRRLFFQIAFAGSLVLFAPQIAHAQQPQPKQTFATAEECMQSGTDAFSHPTCSRIGNSDWVANYGDFGPSAGGGGGAFGAFLLFAILWAAAPAVISGMIASSRGTSVGLAVLLGIVLGWIGLIIVAVAFKPEIKRAAENVIRTAGASPPGTPPARDAAGRLQQLEDLKRSGLITESEYQSRRQDILSEI
jgi:hypothetical protein